MFENHDISSITVDIPDFDGDTQRQLDGITTGWDASEMAMTREAAIARIKAADTPEKRSAVLADLKERAIRRADLDTTGGRVAVVYNSDNGLPWHGLGVGIAQAANSLEAAQHSGLASWLVEQWTLVARKQNLDGTWEEIAVDERMANVRSDSHAVLGVVSSSYKPLQNETAFQFMDAVVGDGLCRYETAGSLQGGRKIWLLAQLPTPLEPVPGDEHTPYALFTSAHDGTMASHVLPTAVRVCCANTNNAALKGADKRKLVIHHRGDIKRKIGEAKLCLGLVQTKLLTLGEQLKALAARSLSGTEVTDYFQSLYPVRVPEAKPVVEQIIGVDGASLLSTIISGHDDRQTIGQALVESHLEEMDAQSKKNKNILEQLMENFESPINNPAGAEKTAYSAYNATTSFVDHQRKYRGKDNPARAENRLRSVWFGEGAQVQEQALLGALALTSK